MPSGRTHLAVELGLLGVYAIPLSYLARSGRVATWQAAAFLSAYLFSSIFLSPDLDLARSRPARRWGVGRLLWLPYTLLFRHRGLSHHLLLGPLTRIAYLGLILALLVWGADFLTGTSTRLSFPRGAILGPVLIGLYLPNQTHSLVDRLGTRRR